MYTIALGYLIAFVRTRWYIGLDLCRQYQITMCTAYKVPETDCDMFDLAVACAHIV